MTRINLNVLVDGLLLLLLGSLLWTAAVLHYVFPVVSNAAGWTLWNGDYDDWRRIHGAALALFSFGILLHLILHWSWLCRFFAGKLTRRWNRPIATDEATITLYGVSLLLTFLTVMGCLLAAAQFAVRSPSDDTHPQKKNAAVDVPLP